jgi:ParB family chromosome partitioning protein
VTAQEQDGPTSPPQTGARRALGRGLDSLIPAPKEQGDFFLCPIERIVPQKGQPRQRFSQETLEELAQSIREQGIVQPLVVRKLGKNTFEIIAGERRWRAAQRAALRDVPVVVKDVSPARAYEMALVENLQREDLNPIERAQAYRQLLQEHGLKHEQLGQRLGKARSTIANSLRLLGLPPGVQGLVLDGQLSEGHARALLGAADPGAIETLARRVVARGLSVRQAEQLAKAAPAARGQRRERDASTPQIRHLEKRLRQKLGCEVRLRDSDGRGRRGVVELRYTSADELERLLDILLAGPR